MCQELEGGITTKRSRHHEKTNLHLDRHSPHECCQNTGLDLAKSTSPAAIQRKMNPVES